MCESTLRKLRNLLYSPSMLVIARHSQSEESPYRGLRGLTRAVQSGADIIHLSVRLTRDKKLVLAESPRIGNHKTEPPIRDATLKELRRHTAGTKQPVVTLADALQAVYGLVMLTIELHERTAVEPLMEYLKPYTKRKSGWDNVLICSSNPLVLRKVRRLSPHAQLALAHGRHTPLVFLAWQPSLQLSAIFVHRLSLNSLVVKAAHRLNLLVCAYTVDRPKTAARLEETGVDAVVTNHPEKFV